MTVRDDIVQSFTKLPTVSASSILTKLNNHLLLKHSNLYMHNHGKQYEHIFLVEKLMEN
jgi:hypothetical protein